MKSKLSIFFLFMCLISADFAFASFPVARTASNSVTAELTVDSAETTDAELFSPAAAGYDKTTALLLWFFLWPFAAHRWYAGKPIGWNILFILTFGGLGIWAIVDLVNIITDKF